MDNNERLTPDATATQQSAQPQGQQSPFSQPAAPAAPLQPAASQTEQATPPANTTTAPADQTTQTQPVDQTPPAAPVNQAFGGLNTSQSMQQPAPVTPAFIPQAMNPARLQGASTATQESMEQKAHYMRDILHKQPKVAIMIPLAFGEKPGTMHPFGINGYFYYVQKGVMVQVPQQIAEMATESFNLDYANGAELDLARNEDKQRNLA